MLGLICLVKMARATRVFFSRAEVQEGGGGGAEKRER